MKIEIVFPHSIIKVESPHQDILDGWEKMITSRDLPGYIARDGGVLEPIVRESGK